MSILFARSHFSIGESTLTPEDIAVGAKEGGYTHAALADTMTISGMVDFTKQCKDNGIKPIIGCRVRIVDDPLYRKPSKASGEKAKPNPECFVDLFITGAPGFQAITKLLTKAFSPDYFYYVPRVALKDVCEALMGGSLCVVPSDVLSVLQHAHARDMLDALRVSHATGERSPLMLRCDPGHTPLNDRLNQIAYNYAFEHGLPFMAAPVVVYASKEDADTRDVYAAICENEKMDSRWLRKPYLRDRCFVPARDLMDRFHAACARIGVAPACVWSHLEDRAAYTWEKFPVSLPRMADNEYAVLVKLCREGWDRRVLQPVLGYQPPKEKLLEYGKRLTFELATLKKMGFEGYFLLVHDVVSWSKAQGIKVGPGRGSVGGSLVAYLIGITDVDPLRFDLLFERFINPDRIDLPDADLDFMSTRRQEIVDYLVGKYGREFVAGISNYGTLASASALRDTGRVFGLEMGALEPTKHIPKVHGKPVALEEAAEEVPTVANFKAAWPEVWKHAVKLEGRMRSLGTHAAGIVVSRVPIVERAVIETRGDSYTINWDKRVSEDMGLVKLDILGLSTLDVIDGALQRLEKSRGTKIDLLQLPLDDAKVLEAFGRGDTAGVFQFEGGGMRKLLKDLAQAGTLTFEDLVAAVALYRPGPMDSGMMDDYVAIRQGLKMPSYPHPSMEAALRETQGVIIYQEQVMQIARDFAGYTLAEADKLRKIMGKKLPEEMAKQKDKWVNGAVAHVGCDPDFAARMFANIETFAAYGFNKSHSVEYAIISYWSQWLRVNAPAEFFAAALDMADADKAMVVATDAAKSNIAVIPPDVNLSSERFEVSYDKAREQWVILAPFSAVKGISTNGCKAIVEGRAAAGGKFRDAKHFEDSVQRRLVNSRVRDALEKVGAMAAITPGSLPARHPDRLKDQLTLLPGIMLDAVKADRRIVVDPHIKAKLIHVVNEVRSCDKCHLKDRIHPMPCLGAKPKFMVVSDCPAWSEDQAGKMMMGKSGDYLREALGSAGLRVADGYFTSLVKSMKEEGGLTNEALSTCPQWLEKEMELLKPPVIVALGSKAIQYLLPNVKGSWQELAGRRVYDSKRDATIVCAFNPGAIAFDVGRQETLNQIFAAVAELL